MSATQLVPDEELAGGAPPRGGAPRQFRADLTLLPATFGAALASLLTTAAMFAVVRPGDWFARSVGVVALIAAVGAAARSVRAPRVAVVAAQAAAALAYVTALYAPGPAAAGLLPLRKEAWARLGTTFEDGLLQLGALAPPVPASPAITFVAVVGVALTAVLVDALAVTYRRPAMAGMPLLAAYLILAGGLPDGLPMGYFLLPATGYLVLLLVDGRARGAGLGRVIVPMVLALAVGIPAVTPQLPEGALSRIGTQGENRTISTLNPLVDLRRDLLRGDDFPLLTLRTDASHPDELYLRTVTLDQFDGERWTFGRRSVEAFSTELPTPPGLRDAGAIPVETVISIGDRLASDYLPLPHPALRVDVPGSWRVDPETGNVVSREGRRQVADTTYNVTSLELAPPDPSVVASAGIVFGPYTALPENLPGEVADTARAVTAGTTTALDAALALQAWFRNPRNFTYDLSVAPGTGEPAILDFLHDRRGYCEQFAATMAVMARTLGIPARVNVGFTAGSPNANGSRTVSSRDAHAWPELELPGIGWTRFEPTPASASSSPAVPSWMDVQDEAGAGGTEEQPATPEDTTAPGPQPAGTPAAPDTTTRPACTGAEADPACKAAATATPDQGGTDGGLGTAGTLLLAAAVLLLLAVPAASRAVIRRRRWSAAAGSGAPRGRAAEAAWREVRDDALDLGYQWPAAHTPRQAAEALAEQARLSDTGADALATIRATVERARYARGEAAGQPGSDLLRPTVALLRRELAAGVARPARVRARILPPSLLLLRNGAPPRARTQPTR